MASRERCRECNREIVWVHVKETGASLPCDPSAPTYTLQKDILGVTVAVRSDAMVSHYNTCTKAGRERFSGGNPLRTLKSEIARGL